jgi:hypothetical protein
MNRLFSVLLEEARFLAKLGIRGNIARVCLAQFSAGYKAGYNDMAQGELFEEAASEWGRSQGWKEIK